MIEKKLRMGANIISFNSRDFSVPKEYQYPDNWRYIHKIVSPRSWTVDMPLDVLSRRSKSQTTFNEKVITEYNNMILPVYRERLYETRQKVKSMRKHIEKLSGSDSNEHSVQIMPSS